jgi:hypothetical protein
MGSSPHRKLRRRVAALHGGFTVVRDRSRASQVALALHDVDEEPKE